MNADTTATRGSLEYWRSTRDQANKAIAELEAQLAREEAAEREAASQPQAPAIPEDVLGRIWDQGTIAEEAWREPWYSLSDRAQKELARVAREIAAHVVAQGTRVWVPPSIEEAAYWVTARHCGEQCSRPAVLLYTDGQP